MLQKEMKGNIVTLFLCEEELVKTRWGVAETPHEPTYCRLSNTNPFLAVNGDSCCCQDGVANIQNNDQYSHVLTHVSCPAIKTI